MILRDFTENDVDSLITILNDPAVTQFLSTKIASPYTKEDALWWINKGSKSELIKAISVDGILVGCIGINTGEFEYERSGEIGYWLAKPYWRKGIMSAAIRQMSEHALSHTHIVRLFASVFSGNHPSMQLLLKSGYKQEAILERSIFKNGHFYDNHIFSLLKPL
ncbi:GNAT family N-acetyltransferase [Alteromonas sp. A079]|uniref:GNAT family N-acetyltransferase n=1 Tax=Alteromonas sp. A079 TaxID=3410268 RepID=UPI003BA2788C